ncbi:type II toxin-antitoxin system death-on-curing family toxin, partial [Methanomethylophilus alvi]|uniref:type II toxin-antitoxin system death-on-curing family toxin n=1 Tax=Methanomethylophilus alvi TaxID=1291540 RepID=UPI0037DD5F21
ATTSVPVPSAWNVYFLLQTAHQHLVSVWCCSKLKSQTNLILIRADFHPFVEGNKRTAFQLAIALLRNGGYELDDDTATASFIIEVASGLYSREEIEEWLRRNTHQVIL